MCTCGVQRPDALLHEVQADGAHHANGHDAAGTPVHGVRSNGGPWDVAVLVEDAAVICLTNGLGGAGAAHCSLKGGPQPLELGLVKVAGQAAGGLPVWVGRAAWRVRPPHVICASSSPPQGLSSSWGLGSLACSGLVSRQWQQDM